MHKPVHQYERSHIGKERVRTAVGAAVQTLKKFGLTEINVDPCAHPQAASEAAHLVDYDYDEMKSKKRKPLTLNLFDDMETDPSKSAANLRQWKRGAIFARAQNAARTLCDAPANVMTPEEFANRCAAAFPTGVVAVRDRKWLEDHKMGALLSVARGSSLEPRLVEIRLGNQDKTIGDQREPLVLVGKGVTYDTGGIMLKPPGDLGEMHADMQGAASVFGAALGLHKLGAPLRRPVVVLCALAENGIGPMATRPGDVVRASNGRTIKVDNTDAEGRLCMADALVHSNSMKPHAVLTVATLTGLVRLTLGHTAAVWSSDDNLYSQLEAAAAHSGDRMWRMPLWSKKIPQSFTECGRFAHFDIAGMMRADPKCTYVNKGMSGQPTRMLLQWLCDSAVA